MICMFRIKSLLSQCDRTLQLSIKEFIHNHYGHLMMHQKPLIKGSSLLPQMMQQYAKLYFFRSLAHRLENLFQVIIVHIKENQNHWYQTFVPIDHLLVRK